MPLKHSYTMKKSILSIILFTGSFMFAQKNDSTKTKSIDEVIIKGKYYKNYTAKEVSGSLRLDTPLLETPQNIQVITSAALSDQQIIGISDGVLRNVSGATRLEHWADMYARVNMRGSRAAAFINGVNVTSNWGPLAEDISYVDRIEFMKGPAGFMMSNGEPAGIYNIVTKKPFFTERLIKGSASFTTGSYNLYRGETDVNATISKNIAFRLNLMGQNKKSFRDYEFNDRYIVNPSVTYKFSDKTQLTAEYIFQKAQMSEVGSAYIFSTEGYATYDRKKTLSDPDFPKTNMDEHYANLNFQTEISDNWKFTAQASYMYDYQLGGDVWPSKVNSDGTIVRNFHFWEAKNDMKFGQVFLNGKIRTDNISHKILTGLDYGNKEYLADWGQTYALDTDANPFYMSKSGIQIPINGYPIFNASTSLEERATAANSILKQNYLGVYLQDEIGFFQEKLRLTLAGRYTAAKQNDYGTEKKAYHFTPRIGLSATILKDFTLYWLYDQSFIPQSGLLRDGSTPPITGENIELGLKKDWFNGKFNSTLSIYKITKNNELVAEGGTSRYSIIKGQSVAKGIELDIKGELFEGVNIIMNYALTDNEITKSYHNSMVVGNKVAGYAKHNFNSWLNYTFSNGILKGFGAQLGFTFLGERTSWTWGAANSNIQPMDDYRKWDAGVFWGNKNLKITLNAFNILDEYLYSGSYYGRGNYYYYQAEAPRNYRLSVKYKF